jgi:hypothetical protein
MQLHCLLKSPLFDVVFVDVQVACKYAIPAEMISGVYRKTKKKGLVVHVDDIMVSQFQNEDDFIISLIDNRTGNFDVYIHY